MCVNFNNNIETNAANCFPVVVFVVVVSASRPNVSPSGPC